MRPALLRLCPQEPVKMVHRRPCTTAKRVAAARIDAQLLVAGDQVGVDRARAGDELLSYMSIG